MRPIAYNHLNHLSNEFTNPSRAFWLMRDYVRKAIKLTNDTMTKNTILKFKNAKIGLKDVEDVASSMKRKMKSSDNSREAKYEIVNDLMKHRIKDALKCAQFAKKDLNTSMENLSKVVRRGTFVRKEFMHVVDEELRHVWKESKEKSNDKVTWNIKKHIDKVHSEEGIFKGVFI